MDADGAVDITAINLELYSSRWRGGAGALYADRGREGDGLAERRMAHRRSHAGRGGGLVHGLSHPRCAGEEVAVAAVGSGDGMAANGQAGRAEAGRGRAAVRTERPLTHAS